MLFVARWTLSEVCGNSYDNDVKVYATPFLCDSAKLAGMLCVAGWTLSEVCSNSYEHVCKRICDPSCVVPQS